MKKNTILSLMISLLFLFLILNDTVYAQVNPEEQARKYNVTFPVAELENCTSFSACRTYCEDATHSAACIAFAKKKGFYKEQQMDTKKQALIQAAKTELGCNSEESCRATCEQEINFEKCQKFAQKNGLDEGRKDQKSPADKTILQKAKTILGCNSPSSCKAICEQETNREKCSEFAKQAGLEGGIRHAGPGGCNSETSCRSYCEKNPDECKKFAGRNNQGDDREHQNKGPGGCDSEASCRKYCTEHPNECRRSSDDSEDKFSGQQSSGEIRSPGGCNSEESCRVYCEKNPTECQKKIGPKERGPSGMPGLNVSGPPPGISPLISFPPQDIKQPSEEQFREQRKRMEEQFREQRKNDEEQQREQRKQMEEQRREERKDFQEQQREQMKQTNEFRSTEDKTSEVKGASTISSFFQRFVNFFLGK